MTNKAITTPKKATTNTTPPAKAPTKPKAKRSYNKNTKVASEAKTTTNVVNKATKGSDVELTVEELKAGQANLSRLLDISNQKLIKAYDPRCLKCRRCKELRYGRAGCGERWISECEPRETSTAR